jgi:AbrB family looped-hinge helix DNA binding protein
MAHIKTKVAEGGRIVIPAEYRQALGIQIGDEVILELDGEELCLFTVEQGIKRAQELVSRYVYPERSLADELIAERRRESWGEE